MFYTCAEEDFPIVPGGFEYRDPNIAWVDNAWFVPHAFHHFGAKHIDVTVRVGTAVNMDDAEALRTHVHHGQRHNVWNFAKHLTIHLTTALQVEGPAFASAQLQLT